MEHLNLKNQTLTFFKKNNKLINNEKTHNMFKRFICTFF